MGLAEYGVNGGVSRRLTSGLLWESITAFAAGAAGRGAGFVLTLLIAKRLGATSDTDAFYLALSVTVYLSEIVRMGIEGALVPAFVSVRARDERRANEFFAGTATLFMGAGLFVATAISTCAAVLSRHGGLGPFSAESLQYLAWLAFFLVPTLGTTAASMVLYARHAFVVPALSPLVQALAVLAVLLLYGSTMGAGALVAGYLAGGGLQLVLLLLILAHLRVPIRLVVPAAPVLAACRAAIPIAVGGVLLNANALVDKIVAGWLLPAGNISVLENAGRVYAILTFLSYSALANVLTIRWSELARMGDVGGLRRSFVRTMRPAMLLVASVGLVMAWVSEPVVEFLFAHGAYTTDAVASTAEALALLALGLPLFCFSGMAARLLYATGETTVSAKGAALALAVNVPADVVLGWQFGVVGIAGATTATYLVVAVYYSWCVRKRLAAGDDRSEWSEYEHREE